MLRQARGHQLSARENSHPLSGVDRYVNAFLSSSLERCSAISFNASTLHADSYLAMKQYQKHKETLVSITTCSCRLQRYTSLGSIGPFSKTHTSCRSELKPEDVCAALYPKEPVCSARSRRQPILASDQYWCTS